MSEHSQSHSAHPPAKGKGYETTDAKPPILLRWGVGILITVSFAFGLMFLTFLAFGVLRAKLEDSQPTQMQLESTIPNAPLLQVDQSLDLRIERAKVRKVLTEYSHDAKTGGWRIPVDDAIKILAQRGLPEPKGPAPEVAKK